MLAHRVREVMVVQSTAGVGWGKGGDEGGDEGYGQG